QTTIGMEGMTASRPFLEWNIRRAVTALPNVTILGETAVEALKTNADHSRVTGVKITRRAAEAANAVSEVMNADLVVDASGRGSLAPKWLQELGYEAPQEEEVKIRFGYATRMYRREPDANGTAPLAYVIAPTPPARHGAILFPIEGDRWIVTAGGYLGDH